MNKYLVGKQINSIQIAKDKKALKFVCEDGEHVAKIDADCCSETWIQHIETPAANYPLYVIDQHDLELGSKELKNGNEYKDYGHRIVTDKGEIIIDYRNESNGYYGGSICWPDESFYGGVYGQNESDNEWENL